MDMKSWQNLKRIVPKPCKHGSKKCITPQMVILIDVSGIYADQIGVIDY